MPRANTKSSPASSQININPYNVGLFTSVFITENKILVFRKKKKSIYIYMVLMSLGPSQNHTYDILGPEIGNYKFSLAGCRERKRLPSPS